MRKKFTETGSHFSGKTQTITRKSCLSRKHNFSKVENLKTVGKFCHFFLKIKRIEFSHLGRKRPKFRKRKILKNNKEYRKNFCEMNPIEKFWE